MSPYELIIFFLFLGHFTSRKRMSDNDYFSLLLFFVISRHKILFEQISSSSFLVVVDFLRVFLGRLLQFFNLVISLFYCFYECFPTGFDLAKLFSRSKNPLGIIKFIKVYSGVFTLSLHPLRQGWKDRRKGIKLNWLIQLGSFFSVLKSFISLLNHVLVRCKSPRRSEIFFSNIYWVSSCLCTIFFPWN